MCAGFKVPKEQHIKGVNLMGASLNLNQIIDHCNLINAIKHDYINVDNNLWTSMNSANGNAKRASWWNI